MPLPGQPELIQDHHALAESSQARGLIQQAFCAVEHLLIDFFRSGNGNASGPTLAWSTSLIEKHGAPGSGYSIQCFIVPGTVPYASQLKRSNFARGEKVLRLSRRVASDQVKAGSDTKGAKMTSKGLTTYPWSRGP